jgi:hypothetical protein
MIVEEPKVVNAPHQKSVVLSKVKVREDTAALYRCRLLESEPNDLNLLVLGWLKGNEVAKLAIVEGLDLLELIGLLLDLTISQAALLERYPGDIIYRVLLLFLIQVNGLEICGSLRVLFNGGIEEYS